MRNLFLGRRSVVDAPVDRIDVKLRQRLMAALLALCGPVLAVAAEAPSLFLPAPAAEPADGGFRVPLASILGRSQAAVALPKADGRARTFLSIDAGPGLSLLCDGSYGLTAALADVGRHCLQGRLDAQGWTLGAPTSVAITHQLQLGEEASAFDLDFGLSWLDTAPDRGPEIGAVDLFDARFQPSAGLLDDLHGSTLSISGTQWLGERSWLRVTGSSSRFRAERPLLAGPVSWASEALRVDAGFGAFAGSLTGHRTDSRQAARAWFNIDLGVSWRTPWSGRFTFGARNLLGNDGANATPGENDPSSRLMEARTPYVRYQQDL